MSLQNVWSCGIHFDGGFAIDRIEGVACLRSEEQGIIIHRNDLSCPKMD